MILAVSSGENKPEKKFYCSILHLTEQYTGQCPLSVPACATQELKTGAYLHLHKLLTDNIKDLLAFLWISLIQRTEMFQ